MTILPKFDTDAFEKQLVNAGLEKDAGKALRIALATAPAEANSELANKGELAAMEGRIELAFAKLDRNMQAAMNDQTSKLLSSTNDQTNRFLGWTIAIIGSALGIVGSVLGLAAFVFKLHT